MISSTSLSSSKSRAVIFKASAALADAARSFDPGGAYAAARATRAAAARAQAAGTPDGTICRRARRRRRVAGRRRRAPRRRPSSTPPGSRWWRSPGRRCAGRSGRRRTDGRPGRIDGAGRARDVPVARGVRARRAGTRRARADRGVHRGAGRFGTSRCRRDGRGSFARCVSASGAPLRASPRCTPSRTDCAGRTAGTVHAACGFGVGNGGDSPHAQRDPGCGRGRAAQATTRTPAASRRVRRAAPVRRNAKGRTALSLKSRTRLTPEGGSTRQRPSLPPACVDGRSGRRRTAYRFAISTNPRGVLARSIAPAASRIVEVHAIPASTAPIESLG